MPECPYDVSSTAGSMETVLLPAGYVVGNVTVEEGETALSALLVRKTIAAPGAGTRIEHVFASWSHSTVVTFSVPWRRPSDWKLLPRVYRRCPMASSVPVKYRWNLLACPAQVMSPIVATESARRYLESGVLKFFFW
jgi:hypothetical protein